MEVQPVVLHDFAVAVESDGRTYQLEHVLLSAHAYVEAVEKELVAAEEKWSAG